MKLVAKATATALLFATLSACGQSTEEATLNRAEQFDAMTTRVSTMSLTGPAKVDAVTGSASFSGYAGIVAGSDYNLTVLVGDADLTVNFNGSGSVNGTVSNISGVAGFNTYSASETGTIDDYSGNIAISGGSVGSGNAVRANYNGTLRGNGDTLSVGGTMYGQFYGNPNIRAVELEGYDYATLNGSTTTAGVFVTAERN